ncbi:MAG: hypothetical protein ACRDQB_00135, partial [Thermocrispum sp.]
TAVAAVAAVAVVGAHPGAAATTAPAPKRLCTLEGDRLTELSGLASDGENLYGVNDGGSQVEVVVLDRQCQVRRTITAGIDPYDVEDLALARDGTLWLSDTGDNGKDRDTVALIKVGPNGHASLHRLTYPDGQHDTEAILLDRSGRPHLVTKNVLGRSDVYRPTGKLRSPGPTPLAKVGDVSLQSTDPGGPPEAGAVGSILVTGGAVSRGGTVVALRTYNDAYLFPAPDGDVVKALGRTPVRIPLPNEPQGEAIAFDPDGTLLSAGEGSRQPIRSVPGAAARATPKPVGESDDGGETSTDAATGEEQERSALPAIAVAATAAALLWFGLGRLRRRRR